jgi:hypothetical protein
MTQIMPTRYTTVEMLINLHDLNMQRAELLLKRIENASHEVDQLTAMARGRTVSEVFYSSRNFIAGLIGSVFIAIVAKRCFFSLHR